MNFDMFPDGKDLVIGYCGGDYARKLSEAGTEEARAMSSTCWRRWSARISAKR